MAVNDKLSRFEVKPDLFPGNYDSACVLYKMSINLYL